MPANGRAVPAPMSTERSDAESEGLQKDGVGRWTRFRPIAERHDRDARCVVQHRHDEHLHDRGQARRRDLRYLERLRCVGRVLMQSTGVDGSSPSHGMPAAIRSLIRSAAESVGQT